MTIPLNNDFASLSGQLQSFSSDMRGMIANSDGQTQNVINSLLKIWDEHFIKAQTAYPEAMSQIEQHISDTQNHIESLKTKVATAKQQVSEAKQAQAAAAAAKKAGPKIPPLKPIDPELGPSLRDELLEKFGVKGALPDLDLPEGVREIWEGWEFEPWDKK